jgi:hypothetical protein
MEKKYNYHAESCYANGYRCDVVFGSKLGPAIISTGTSSDWGAGGSIMGFGDLLKPLPDTIRLAYYSLPENQFYALITPLPQERIKELLEKRYPDPRGGADLYYATLTVGMAPCGYISLWIQGNAGWLLIDTFRAKKIEMDYNIVFPDRGWSREEAFAKKSLNLYSFIRTEMRDHTLSSRYWEDLTKTYRWKLRITDPGFEIYDYSAYTINVEHRPIESAGDWLTTQGEKAVPAEFILYLKHDKDPDKYMVELVFEPAVLGYDSGKSEEGQVLRHMNRNRQLMRLFEDFYALAGNEEVELVIDLNKEMTGLTVKLKSQSHEMEIPGCTVHIYSSEKYKLE